MTKTKPADIAKEILNWLVNNGVDLTVFTAAGLSVGAKWTIPKLVKLIKLSFKEVGNLGGNALTEFGRFISLKLPKPLKKIFIIKDGKADIDEKQVANIDEE